MSDPTPTRNSSVPGATCPEEKLPRPLIYVSGPYRAATPLLICKNVVDAWKDALQLWKAGAAVICPHTNTAGMGTELLGADPEVTPEDCIEGDLVMIERCDVIYMRPGWQASKGAREELAHATKHSIFIYYDLQLLLRNLHTRELQRDIKEDRDRDLCEILPDKKPSKDFTEFNETLKEFDPVKLAGRHDSLDAFVESQKSEGNPKDLAAQTKAPLHLVPAVANHLESFVMQLGAKKYGPYNWRKTSVRATVYVAAARRHLDAWFDGETHDQESGCSHLAHVRANMSILLDAEDVGMLQDDRPHGPQSKYLTPREDCPKVQLMELEHELETLRQEIKDEAPV